jgi:glycosyltransferase involved in cell wall biosynthesis
MTRAAETAEGVTLTLMVACYNEAPNIRATLDALIEALARFQFTWEIIIIDDASSDGTAAVVEDYLRRNQPLPLRLVCNARNEGLAQNYINGAFFGHGEYYRLICGDNVEPMETFVDVFSRLGEADMIVPYHPQAQGRTVLRRGLSGIYTRLINLISGYRLQYYNGLAVLRRWDVMRWHTNYHGFGFQADMLVRLLDEGRSYIEIPVAVHERRAGTSSALRLRNILSVAHTLLDLVIRRVGRRMRRQSPALAPKNEVSRPNTAEPAV